MPVHQKRFVAEIHAGRIVPGMSFQEKVLALTARIPPGRVATYGDLAHQLASRGYRAVGHALHNNPYAPNVPCHRVVGSDGRLTGYAGGLPAKRRLLQSEGVTLHGSHVDLQRHRLRSPSPAVPAGL
jgi:methylated-DNA-[protein]-cysteine S-methyltransferase